MYRTLSTIKRSADEVISTYRINVTKSIVKKSTSFRSDIYVYPES